MARVVFTPNLDRHIDCPPRMVSGSTVREALDAVFADNDRLRGYVLDDQQRLRRHMVIFVNGRAIEDRVNLGDPIADDDEVYVLQALSGG